MRPDHPPPRAATAAGLGLDPVVNPTIEAVQLGWIAEWAERYGVLVHHCRDSRHCDGQRGLPDVILAGPRGVLFVELKSSMHGMTSHQRTWHWMLKAAGAQVVTWLPSHFRNGTAEAAIAAIGRPEDMSEAPRRP